MLGECLGITWQGQSPCLAEPGPGDDHWGLADYSKFPTVTQWKYVATYTPEELVEQIHASLDNWALRDLSNRLYKALINHDLQEYPLKVEEQLAQEMWRIWETWRPLLENSRDLRRHFMRVMLGTAIKKELQFRHNRVGRRTIGKCLLHGVVFALAVTVALPREFVPAAVNPFENLTTPKGGGHLCGLEVIGGVELSQNIAALTWETDCVLLPHYIGPPEEIPGLNKRFRESAGVTHRFDRPTVYSPLIFTGEYDLRRALGEGKQALHLYLLSVVKDWDDLQSAEIKEATGGRDAE